MPDWPDEDCPVIALVVTEKGSTRVWPCRRTYSPGLPAKNHKGMSRIWRIP